MLTGRGSVPFFGSRSRGERDVVRVVPAAARHVAGIRKIVARDPIRAVHTGAQLASAPRRLSPRLWALVEGERIVGALQNSRGFSWVLAEDARQDPRLLAALAAFIGNRAGITDIVVGVEEQVLTVVDGLRIRGVEPVEIRHQEMMAIWGSPRAVEAYPGYRVRKAGPADVPWLLEAHAAMCREDLGVDQVARNRAGYEVYFHDLVAHGRSIIGEDLEGRAFKAEVALRSGEAWLVEGVYTVPRARGRGYAKFAMADIAADARRSGHLTCLYVHRRNAPALAVYRAIGFETISPWLTVLTDRDRRGRPRQI